MANPIQRCGVAFGVWVLGWAATAMLACGPADTGREGGRLLVGAASDLALVMPELIEQFEREAGFVPDVTLGSSGQIAHQIANGAPIDVFLSADRVWVERLGGQDRIAPGTAAVYARGVLVIATPRGARSSIRELADLDRPSVGRIALANPEHAPYGRAARQALEAAGVWAALEPRIVLAENVRQAIQYVETGAVDAAVGALSLMQQDRHAWFVVSDSLHAPLDQTAVLTAGRPNEAAALAFTRFLLGPIGRETLGRYGFVLPESGDR